MEKSTRDRLTGAVILVAVLPIVVEELLTGPGGDDTAQVAEVADAGPPLATYDLAIDSDATDASPRQQELAAASARESEAIAQAVPPPVTAPPESQTAVPPTPLPAASAAESARVAQAPAPAREPSAATTPASEAPRAAAVQGRWWVQLGSFSSADNAQRLARDLRAKGFSIDVSQVSASGKHLHRVRAGPAPDRGAAVALRDRLAANGQKGTLVVP